MHIRERFGGIVCLIPGLILLLVGRCINSTFVTGLSLLLGFLSIAFSSKIYQLIFYDKNTTCALFAGNLALQYGFSPEAQNGRVWNPENFSVSQIYRLYPANRTKSPKPGTAGFLFYTNRKGSYSRHMEFYDYRAGGDTFIYYQFYFHTYKENGDEVTRREEKICNINQKRIFVPLNKLD